MREKFKIKYICGNDESHDKFQTEGSTSTLMAVHISYDKYGRPLNPDFNTVSEAFRCSECGFVGIKNTKGWSVEFVNTEDRKIYLTQDITPEYIKRRADGKAKNSQENQETVEKKDHKQSENDG